MNIAITVAGMPAGWSWRPRVWVATDLPFVQLWTAYGKEGAQDATVTAKRTGSTPTMLKTALQVDVKDSGGTLGDDDYQKIDKIVIPAVLDDTAYHQGLRGDAPLHVNDDATSEWTENTYYSIKPSKDYHIETVDPQKVEVVDNDIDITGLPKILQVNNNDSDNNGEPDMSQSGGVSGGDPNLFELDLKFPHGDNPGAEVMLSSGGSFHFWKNKDHTGPLGSGHTWVIGEESPPEKVYVEAIGGSGSVDDMRVTLADDESDALHPGDAQTSNHTPTTGPASAPYRATNIGIYINAGGIDVTGEKRDWLIGQYAGGVVTVAAPAAWKQNMSYDWTVPGDTLYDYHADDSNAWTEPLTEHVVLDVANHVPSEPSEPIDTHTGTKQQEVRFFWVSTSGGGLDEKTLTVKVQAAGKESTAQTTYNLYAPLSTFAPVIGETGRGDPGQHPHSWWGLGPTPNLSNPGTKKPGITFPATVDLSGPFANNVQGAGIWYFTQLITARNYQIFNGVLMHVRYAEQKVLDQDVMLEHSDTHVNSSQTGTPWEGADSPRNVLSPVIDWTGRDSLFETYLMFVPPGDDVSPVPLKVADWGFGGAAVWNAPTSDWENDVHHGNYTTEPIVLDNPSPPVWSADASPIVWLQ